MSKLTPGLNRVLVLPDAPNEKIGNLLVPENKKKIPNHGKVIAVGRLTDHYAELPNPPKAGMTIHFRKDWENLAGYEITLEGVKMYLFHIDYVLGYEHKKVSA